MSRVAEDAHNAEGTTPRLAYIMESPAQGMRRSEAKYAARLGRLAMAALNALRCGTVAASHAKS